MTSPNIPCTLLFISAHKTACMNNYKILVSWKYTKKLYDCMASMTAVTGYPEQCYEIMTNLLGERISYIHARALRAYNCSILRTIVNSFGELLNLPKTLCICILQLGEGTVSWYGLRTYGCHRNGWRWCRGRCSAGPADLSSQASCCGSTATSSRLCAQQWTPDQPRTRVRSGMFRARILDPAGAPRSVIRAAPLWQLNSDHIL